MYSPRSLPDCLVGFKTYFLLCIWVFLLHICSYTTFMPGAFKARRSIGPPGTKLQMVMSHHVGAGNCVKGGESRAITRHLECIFHFWCVSYSFFPIQEKLNTESVIIHLREDAIKCKIWSVVRYYFMSPWERCWVRMTGRKQEEKPPITSVVENGPGSSK